MDEITFDADSFSVYGVLYSVDFIYEGYKFSMEGEGSILLSELADRLELYEKDYDKAFSVKNVSSVSFTDNDLLKVEKQADGDWLLTSLASFTSGEILTIEMNDGAKFLIEVTDPPANQTGSTTTDLSKVLSSVTITGNGETFDANGQVTLIRGVEYRIDLNDVAHLHWWKFMAMFEGLSRDHEIQRIMQIRGTDLASIENQKERQRIAKLQDRYRICNQSRGKRLQLKLLVLSLRLLPLVCCLYLMN